MSKYDSQMDLDMNTTTGKIAQWITPNSTVLEFGAAHGRMTRYMKETLGCKVYIVEIDNGAYQNAITYAEDGICGDISEYVWCEKFGAVKFDFVIFADVLEHLYNPQEILERTQSFLKDDGSVIVSVPNLAHVDVLLNLFDNSFKYTKTGLLDDTHIRFFSYNMLESFFGYAGYRVVEEDGTTADAFTTEQCVKPETIDKKVLSCILNKDLYNIYQFVYKLQKKEYAASNHIEKISHLNFKESYFSSSIFCDFGCGYTNEQSLIVKPQKQGCNRYNYEIFLPSGCKSIRFDPIEQKGCVIYNLKVQTSNGIISAEAVNGCHIGLFDIFTCMDPQLEIDFHNNPTEWVRIEANIEPVEDMLSLELLSQFSTMKQENQKVFESAQEEHQKALESAQEEHQKALESVQEECQNALEIEQIEHKRALEKAENEFKDIEIKAKDEHQKLVDIMKLCKNETNGYKNNFEATKNQLNESRTAQKKLEEDATLLSYEISCLKEQYSSVANSTCWKMTKPVRWMLDLIKSCLKKNRMTLLFYKGIVSLRNDGILSTAHKVGRQFRQADNNTKYSDIAKNEDSYSIKIFEPDLNESLMISILVPLYNTPEQLLTEMILSVQAQTYGNWELCLVDGSDAEHVYVKSICEEFAKNDSRVLYEKLAQNRGISENTNACATMATGKYIALLDHDDLLLPHALYAVAASISLTGADVLYSDEDKVTMSGIRKNPFYKPDWSPCLLYSQMYICHLLVFRAEVFNQIGGFRKEFDGSQDYDLMLRMSEITQSICHIPMVLYSWRESESSTASNSDSKPYAHEAGKKALQSHLDRKYDGLATAIDGKYTFTFDVRFQTLAKQPKVSIIMPMKDNVALSKRCIDSILQKSTYNNYEIIVLDNRSEEKETFQWLGEMAGYGEAIKVIRADFEFNWSKLNNFGMRYAQGKVYIFLNNDVEVISPDWIERLAENAMRDEVGVVGALLHYEDNTIQHAGVVVGFGGFADHVFKGMKPDHYGCPFVSPVLSRNVLAVTGACMAVSKRTVEKIGDFNEAFVICGSDVEICLRAHEFGLNNLYNAYVELYHLESKSRDNYIPQTDFEMSNRYYADYRDHGDPFYNINLDLNSVSPKVRGDIVDWTEIRNRLKSNAICSSVYGKLKKVVSDATFSPTVGETQPIDVRRDELIKEEVRLNLLVPSLNTRDVFGGISTAIKLFNCIVEKMGCCARLIVTDAALDDESAKTFDKYSIVNDCDSSSLRYQIIPFSDRYLHTIPVGKNDIFVATGWWTAYTIASVIQWQGQEYSNSANPLIYIIQDYEPGFYQWSSRYLMAESTYKTDNPVFAIFNSGLLRDFFEEKGYRFEKEYCFDPVLNEKLKQILSERRGHVKRKKQVLVYGRPSTQRNGFELVVDSLKRWCRQQENVQEWTLISAGETHPDVNLGNGMHLKSVGKMSLEQYAQMLLETYMGISIMVSPHPSYPPLEMAAFGVKTVTNNFENKDLSGFSKNLVSLENCTDLKVAAQLSEFADAFAEDSVFDVSEEYLCDAEVFDAIADKVKDDLLQC